MTEQEIQQEVTAIVAEVTEMDKDEIWEKRDANFFKELEVDSLLALEILAHFQNLQFAQSVKQVTRIESAAKGFLPRRLVLVIAVLLEKTSRVIDAHALTMCFD